MTSTVIVTRLTSHSGGAGTVGRGAADRSLGANLPLEAGTRRGEGIGRDVFVNVDRLRVLAKVVQA